MGVFFWNFLFIISTIIYGASEIPPGFVVFFFRVVFPSVSEGVIPKKNREKIGEKGKKKLGKTLNPQGKKKGGK